MKITPIQLTHIKLLLENVKQLHTTEFNEDVINPLIEIIEKEIEERIINNENISY